MYGADALRIKIPNISMESYIELILFAKHNYSFCTVKLNKRVYIIISII